MYKKTDRPKTTCPLPSTSEGINIQVFTDHNSLSSCTIPLPLDCLVVAPLALTDECRLFNFNQGPSHFVAWASTSFSWLRRLDRFDWLDPVLDWFDWLDPVVLFRATDLFFTGPEGLGVGAFGTERGAGDGLPWFFIIFGPTISDILYASVQYAPPPPIFSKSANKYPK